jgi:hypothetical protein
MMSIQDSMRDSYNRSTTPIQDSTELLIQSLKAISKEYDILNHWVQEQVTKAFEKNKDKTFRDINEAQQKIRVTSEVIQPLIAAILDFEHTFSNVDPYDIDILKIIERNIFRNTILDEAIHTMGDCHHMSEDFRIREVMIRYEKVVILPLTRLYFQNEEKFSSLGHLTLNEEHQEMEYWNVFGDRPPIGRGAYQTFGSLLRNGFFLTIFKILEHRLEHKSFQIPEVFLGNLIGWVYRAKLHEDFQILNAITRLLFQQSDYKVSPGVLTVFHRVLQRNGNIFPIDRIEDYSLLPCDNLLEKSIPEDTQNWRSDYLQMIQGTLQVKMIEKTLIM